MNSSLFDTWRVNEEHILALFHRLCVREYVFVQRTCNGNIFWFDFDINFGFAFLLVLLTYWFTTKRFYKYTIKFVAQKQINAIRSVMNNRTRDFGVVLCLWYFI